MRLVGLSPCDERASLSAGLPSNGWLGFQPITQLGVVTNHSIFPAFALWLLAGRSPSLHADVEKGAQDELKVSLL